MSKANWAEADPEDDLIFTGRRRGPQQREDFPDLLSTLNINDEESGSGDESDASSTYSQYSDDDAYSTSSAESSIIDIEPYDFATLPEHACKYCGIHDECAVAKCNGCAKWFCNGKGTHPSGGSHIVQHLVRAKHREVSLHPDSPVGDATLECYNCGNKNIFLLGYIPAKADTVVVLLCRQPCAGGAGAAKDETWDLESWTPLISERALLSWLVRYPTEGETLRSRPITPEQIIKLEELWKTRPMADLADLATPDNVEDVLERVQTHYDNAYHYQAVMAPLVRLEADQDKMVKEAQRQQSVSIRWDIGLNMKRIAWFYIPTNVDADFRVAPGDEVQLSLAGTKWKASGYVIKTASSKIYHILLFILLFSHVGRNCRRVCPSQECPI